MAIQKLQRVFGLDLLRSAAIIIVTLSHCSSLLANYYPRFPDVPLPDGVDLFFVLSGFLIGSILIASVEKENGLNSSLLRTFLQRRWLRTLPNYFLFLTINILLIVLNIIPGTINKYLVTYFAFFQNFYKPYDFLFWESWSLAVEEWFYLLFPFLLLLLFTAFKRIQLKHLMLFSILLFLFFPLLLRTINTNLVTDVNFLDLYIRKLVITRLDCIGYGLLAAFLKFYFPLFWNKGRIPFFIAGIGLLILILLNSNSATTYFNTVWYFSFIGISVLLLLPLLDNLKQEKIPFKPFEFISRISYSMYLVQIPLLQLFVRYYTIGSAGGAIAAFIFYWLLLIALSAFIYKFFEKPFLRLRLH